MSSTVTGNPSINSGSMHDPTAVSGNERREFVNMFGTGQSNYTFVVNEETGTIFQVTIDDDGTFNDRIPVGSAIKFKDASGNSASLPGMYNDQGEVVAFNDYYVGDDGYLYGNVGEPGVDPSTIGDLHSTWVKLKPADESVDLPKDVSFAVIVDGSGKKSIGVKQDFGVAPPAGLTDDPAAAFDSSVGNIPLIMDDVELSRSGSEAIENFKLPVDDNNEAFDGYFFREVDGQLRLYVQDDQTMLDGSVETRIYDMGVVPEDSYGNSVDFKDGDSFGPPSSAGDGNDSSSKVKSREDNYIFEPARVRDDKDGYFARVTLDGDNTFVNLEGGKDRAMISELGVDDNGNPIEYHVELGTGSHDLLILPGPKENWSDIQKVEPPIMKEGRTFDAMIVHETTGTVVYFNEFTNVIEFLGENGKSLPWETIHHDEILDL